jgi:hypothetical protein
VHQLGNRRDRERPAAKVDLTAGHPVHPLQVPARVVAGRHHLQNPRLIPRIIQIMRRVPSGSDRTNQAPNLHRAELSGADEIDIGHQSTDLSRTDLLELGPRAQPSLLAQVVILAVIPPGPTTPNQTPLNRMPS